MLIDADLLLVLDNVDELALLSKYFRGKVSRVRQAIDGEMALIAIETKEPDIIVLEPDLARIDGFSLREKIEEKENNIPIIFLLSSNKTEERLKILGGQSSDYLCRPYDIEELYLKIKDRSRTRSAHLQLKQEISKLQEQMNLLELVNRSDRDAPEYLYLLKNAIDAIHNGIAIASATIPDHPIIYVNPGFETMTGYSFAEIYGKNCRILNGNDREQKGLETIRNSLRTGEPCRVTLRNYRKNGELFWNEVSLSAVRDNDGKIVYFIGILTDVTDRKRSEEELQRSKAAAGQMNRELYRLNDRLHRLANLDGLTGLANRRCFDDHLEQEWQRAGREQTPLSLILGDIDYFKRYNDTYGHIEGDACLKAVAGVLAKAIHRPADLAARYGGEEFAIILPNTDLDGALNIANHIRERLEALDIPHISSSVIDRVTMSIGVATIVPSPEVTTEQLRESADRALYLAKQRGRDRIAIAGNELE